LLELATPRGSLLLVSAVGASQVNPARKGWEKRRLQPRAP